MIIYQSTFIQTKKCQWKWPLSMYVISKNAEVETQLLQEKWPSTFIEIIRNEKKPVQLLYFAEGFKHISSFLTSSSIEADIIIIDVHEDYFHSNRNFEEDVQQLQILTEKVNASGLYIVHHQAPVELWFNSFIVELSHNKCVPEALSVCSDYLLISQDDKVQKETTLRFQVDCLKEDLYSLSRDERMNVFVHARLTNHNNINLDEFLSFLENYADHFGYNHESGEAESLSQIYQQIDDQLASRGITRSSADIKISMGSAPQRGDPAKQQPPLPSVSFDQSFSPVAELNSGASPEEVTKEELEEKDTTNETSRFLQAQIFSAEDATQVINDFLLPAKHYITHIRIGHPTSTWIQASTPLPDASLFKDPTLQEEKLLIRFLPFGDEPEQTNEIVLPRNKTKNSTNAVFTFTTKQLDKEFKADVYVYHKSRLLQKATLYGCIGKETKNTSIKLIVEYSFITDFSTLHERTTFGASFVYDNNIKNGMLGVSNNKAIPLYFSSGLEALSKKIKDRIQQAVIDIDDHPEKLSAPQNEKLLLRMALDGNNLFVNHLHQPKDIKGPIQIVSNRPEFVPLDFVYSFTTPDAKSTLCPNAIEALHKGSCQGCEGMETAPAKHICPLGFWGFQFVIERQHIKDNNTNNNGDYTIYSNTQQGKNELHILQNALFAMSDKVIASNPELQQQMETALHTYSSKTEIVTNWNDWSKTISTTSPESLVLLVHIEKDEITEQDQLEIGKGDFLLQNLLDQAKIKKDADAAPPFIILLGCEATNIENYGFDVANQLMHQGAAIVVSNFTKIRGRHAAPILIKLLEFLHANAGKEITLGEITLKLRQYFLAKGIIVSLALITLGDADWKLKT